MKATIDVPEGLYRRVKARAALEGRSVGDVTVHLFERWLAEWSRLADAVADGGRSTAAASWLKRWDAIGARIDDAATDPRTTREMLAEDRSRS